MSSEIGERLRQERHRAGVSALAAAEAMGIARNTLVAVETGRSDLSISQLRCLDALEIDTFFIAHGERVVDFVANHADWHALALLYRLVRDWEQARESRVADARLAPLLEALYPRAAASRDDEVEKLLASLAA